MVLFAVVLVTVLLPLRDRIQSSIDRLFFRSAYDFRRLMETTSAKLASVVDLGVITHELERAVGDALHPEWLSFEVRRRPEGPLVRIAQRGSPPPVAAEAALRAETQAQPFEIEGGALGVPFRVEDRLIALLGLGRRLSGRFYGGDDRRLLHTLANQGGVAINNALALEQLRELNRDLEKKVDERTSELAEALEELRETQAQLVHQEKMASVGQLVAGIAHEINNPLNFIQGNIHYLRKYTEALTGSLGDYERVVTECSPDAAAELGKVRSAHRLDYVLGDLESVFAGCEEGVERTTTLVKDLRTFSRLDLAEISRVNLHEALESTLSLLKGRLGGIRLVKDYGEIPLVECLGSQLNQVFMNLLSNALDAVGESGSITLRTRPQGEGRVAIEVEDDGCGIEPEHLGRIFAPFFTTKPVGQGTGLGLAIAYGVLTRHGAEIRVRSELGRGACFELELPVEFPQADDAGEASSGL
jgi:signal transduction histidine kinase